MQFLRADTEQIVRVGPCVDITDGFTLLATLAISTADYAYLSEHGGVETDISANTWAAVTSVTGWYDLTLTAAQLNTEGPATVMIYDVSLCLPIFRDYMVLPAAVYDSLVLGTDILDTNVTHVSDTAQTANDNGADINAILVDTGTTLPATLAGTLSADVVSISGSTPAANNLEESTLRIITGSAATGTLTTTIFTTGLGATYTTSDALNGRVIIFKGDVTAALTDQAAVISDYLATGGQITLATPLTTAPANTDSFIIV